MTYCVCAVALTPVLEVCVGRDVGVDVLARKGLEGEAELGIKVGWAKAASADDNTDDGSDGGCW